MRQKAAYCVYLDKEVVRRMEVAGEWPRMTTLKNKNARFHCHAFFTAQRRHQNALSKRVLKQANSVASRVALAIFRRYLAQLRLHHTFVELTPNHSASSAARGFLAHQARGIFSRFQFRPAATACPPIARHHGPGSRCNHGRKPRCLRTRRRGRPKNGASFFKRHSSRPGTRPRLHHRHQRALCSFRRVAAAAP